MLRSRSRAVVLAVVVPLLVVAPTGSTNVEASSSRTGGWEIARVVLRGFGSGNVDGLWLWRLEDDGNYRRMCRYVLSDAFVSWGTEVVQYTQQCRDGWAGPPSLAAVARLRSDPSTVQLELIYRRKDERPVAHRASAYSSVGESPLSAGSIPL